MYIVLLNIQIVNEQHLFPLTYGLISGVNTNKNNYYSNIKMIIKTILKFSFVIALIPRVAHMRDEGKE